MSLLQPLVRLNRRVSQPLPRVALNRVKAKARLSNEAKAKEPSNDAKEASASEANVVQALSEAKLTSLKAKTKAPFSGVKLAFNSKVITLLRRAKILLLRLI